MTHSINRLDQLRSVLSGKRPPIRSSDTSQRPLLFVPGLPNRPFYDPADFPWTGLWREAFPSVRHELEECLRQRHGFQPIFPGYADGGNWAGMWFLLYGERYDDNCARCPETINLIQRTPRLAGWCAYSAMSPGSHVRAHCGTTNAKLRLHFAVMAEPGSSMRVRESCYSWSEGDIMIFDDSLEHEVWVAGTRPRVVLICDFYHPDLSDEEVDLIASLETTPTPFLQGDTLRSRFSRLNSTWNEAGASDLSWLYD